MTIDALNELIATFDVDLETKAVEAPDGSIVIEGLVPLTGRDGSTPFSRMARPL